MTPIIITVFIAAVILLIIAAALYFSGKETTPQHQDPQEPYIPPEKAAGNEGERIAANIVRRHLNEDDTLFTNINLSFNNRPAELDLVIVNRCGVLIIEVKNCKWQLEGGENDYFWTEIHTTKSGNTYRKDVRNPISEVRRQEGILGKYLRSRGINVWVNGYAVLLWNNSPVESRYILKNTAELSEAIHTPQGKHLDEATVNRIKKLLSSLSGESIILK